MHIYMQPYFIHFIHMHAFPFIIFLYINAFSSYYILHYINIQEYLVGVVNH